jgi:hypothetical protein
MIQAWREHIEELRTISARRHREDFLVEVTFEQMKSKEREPVCQTV